MIMKYRIAPYLGLKKKKSFLLYTSYIINMLRTPLPLYYYHYYPISTPRPSQCSGFSVFTGSGERVFFVLFVQLLLLLMTIYIIFFIVLYVVINTTPIYIRQHVILLIQNYFPFNVPPFMLLSYGRSCSVYLFSDNIFSIFLNKNSFQIS